MQGISVRAAFYLTKLCIPYLKKAENPHVLMMVPPVDINNKLFLTAHLGYTLSKFGASLMAKGLGSEFEGDIAVNTLWPRTGIDTNAIKNVTNSSEISMLLRKPQIMGMAAATIFKSNSEVFTAMHFIDDEVLIGAGLETMHSVNKYNCDPNIPDYILMPDLLL